MVYKLQQTQITSPEFPNSNGVSIIDRKSQMRRQGAFYLDSQG